MAGSHDAAVYRGRACGHPCDPVQHPDHEQTGILGRGSRGDRPLTDGGIVGLVATVLSAVGLAQVKSKNGKGKGFAIAGLIIGIISIIYGIYSIMNAAALLSTL